MKPKLFIRTADGALTTEDEALDARGILKSGFGYRLGLTRDNAAPELSSQQVYERRISDAWKGEQPATVAHVPITDAVAQRARSRAVSPEQAAYELRVSDAWRTPQSN